jgi:tetratricopeptide (TPR) repeat protein
MRADGMQTYRNERHGFEIDVPEEWSLPTGWLSRLCRRNRNPAFDCGRNEAFNFQIGPLRSEPSLDDTERHYKSFAQRHGYTELEFGRITVHGREHVWVRHRMGHGLWVKKYMIVLGGTEYAITGICANQRTFEQREQIWDATVTSFRLLGSVADSVMTTGEAWAARNYEEKYPERFVLEWSEELPLEDQAADPLYAEAFEAVGAKQYARARVLLERCLRDNPNHTLAHKELALVFRILGDSRNALHHRREVGRLDPSDRTNRYNLAKLLAECGTQGEALQEAEELLAIEPNSVLVQDLVASLRNFPPL